MDIDPRPGRTFLNENQSWIASSHGLDHGRPVTLRKASFTEGLHYPNGFFPSGLALAELVAFAGLYGPASAPNEVQSIAVDATGGTFTITREGEVTGAIAFNASAATVQAAIEGLASVNPGDVTVTGGPGAAGGATPYVVTFGGQFADADQPALTTGAGALTGGAGTAAVTTTTAGSAPTITANGGLLLATIPVAVGGGNVVGALFTHGRVVTSKLPANNGVDVDFKRAVGSRIEWL